MKVINFINSFRSALTEVKNSGQDVVPINRLETYLTEMENIVNRDGTREEQESQQALLNFERDMEVWKVQNIHAVEMFKSVIEAGLNALKFAILVNGGAAAALLAFLGSLLTKINPDGHVNAIGNSVLVSNIGYALFIFLLGAGFAATAGGLRYLSQAAYSAAVDDRHAGKPEHCFPCWMSIGKTINFTTIILALLSFGSFFYGGWIAYTSFSQIQI